LRFQIIPYASVHCLVIEAFSGSRASDASAVLLARVRSNLLRPIGRAARVELANACREPRHERSVQFGAPFRLALATPGPRLRVVQALGFGTLEGLFFDQQSLAFVPLACAAPLQHDGGERGLFLSPPRECRIARREEREMVEIRAAETKRATAAGKNNRGAPAEIFATVVAARLPVRMKTRRSREAPSSAARFMVIDSFSSLARERLCRRLLLDLLPDQYPRQTICSTDEWSSALADASPAKSRFELGPERVTPRVRDLQLGDPVRCRLLPVLWRNSWRQA
jgi:hypothetical protein